MVLAKGIELYERSERIEKISISSVFREAAELQSAALLATYEDIFSGDNNNDNTDQFRASAARLVAAETVIDQIAHTILNETNLGMSRTYLHELAVECIQNSGVNLTDLDDQATHWWEHMLFNSPAGVTASKHIKKVSAVRNHRGRMEVFNPEVAEGVFSEESMMVVLATVRANIAGFRDMSDRFPKEDFVIGHVNELLGDVSEKISSAIRRRHNSAGFQAKEIQGLSELVDEIAIQIEPLLFNRVDAIPYAFSEWADSVTVSAARNTVGILNTDQARVVLRNTFTDPKSDNQFVTSLSHVFSGMDASRQWHSLTKEGRAAAATLCLFEYLPVEQKVKMMQSDPMLVKAWAYLDNTGSKDLRRALSSWRDGAMIAYASSKSAEFTALESVGLLQKAEHIISSAIMPRLPSVTNVESGMRLGSLVIGFSLAGVILSACGGKPPDVSTAMPEKSPTPDLVSLVSTHPALHKMLTEYKISEQCSFPSADVLAPADYITTINSHLTTAEAAFLHVPQTVDLEGYVLICDDNGNVYLQSDQEEILMPTQDGFIEAILVDGNLQAFVPTAEIMPSPTRVYHLDTGGPLTEERFSEIISLDPTVVDQIMWLNDWAAWYDSAKEPPFTAEQANQGIIFFEWTDVDGNIHYRAAWKLDSGYPGFILVPPVINWAEYNPPVNSESGHNIGEGQGPVFISTSVEEGSELYGIGVPAGAQLSVELGTGDWVMVFEDSVVARVDNETGYWERVIADATGTDVEGNPIKPWMNADGTPVVNDKGEQLYLTLFSIPTGPNGEMFNSWASNHIKGSEYIPMLPGGGIVEEGFPMKFFVEDGLDIPFIEHTPGTGQMSGGYMGTVEMALYNRYKLEYPETSRQDFWDNIWPNGFRLTVTDMNGHEHIITSETVFNLIYVNRESIPDVLTPSAVRGNEGSQAYYYDAFDDKQDGITKSINIIFATDILFNQYSDSDKNSILVNEVMRILIFPDLNPNLWKADSGKASVVTGISRSSFRDGYINFP